MFCTVDCEHHAVAMRFHPDRINASVGPNIRRHVLQRLNDISGLCVVDRLSSSLLGLAQAVSETINCDHALRSEHKRTADCEQTDRTTSPDRDRIPALYVAVHRAEVAGGEDVGKKQYFVVRNALRNLQWAYVG